MSKPMSVARYRATDLTLFALMMTVFETVAVFAATRWFPNEPYTVSVVPAVTAIVLMRWGPWAGLHAVLGGVVFCLASRARAEHFLVYGAGNLLSLAALALIRCYTPEGVRESTAKSLLLGLSVTLLMQLGRAIVSLALGAEFILTLGFFTTDVITLLFTLVIVWIVRRLDGMFEDQKHYLLRVHQQENEERGGFR